MRRARTRHILSIVERDLNIEHRRTIERFDGSDAKAITADTTDRHSMKSDGIGPVRRARTEDAGKFFASHAARNDAQDISVRLVEPRDENNLVSGVKAVEAGDEFRLNLKPRVGSAITSLSRRGLAVL